MTYACLGGGKRFRAILVYACGEISGAELDSLDTPAAAVEMVHAYSLAHDDLPAMDDDDLRRGRATCHIEFDEAMAILAGDALQSRALEIVASDHWNPAGPAKRARMVEVLAHAIGSCGMAGGQALDMDATGNSVGFQELVQLHRLKTGALIEASAVLGGLACADADKDLGNQLREYASCIGLAFQVADDILDCTSDSETLGKVAGADHRMMKATYVSTLGLDEARREAARLSDQAIETIRGLGDNREFLEQLARFVVNRKN
jgi:farnesyl diphosphate synthase